jgi:hypothetical protein
MGGQLDHREHMTGKFRKLSLFIISTALLTTPSWAGDGAATSIERLADEYVAARVRHDPRLAYMAGLPIEDHSTLPDNSDAGRAELDAQIDRLRAERHEQAWRAQLSRSSEHRARGRDRGPFYIVDSDDGSLSHPDQRSSTGT